MLYPHRIRLRGPWECVPLAAPAGTIAPMPRRITMPGRFADHGLAGFAGRALFTRKFGYPGRIDDHERVWITCAGMDGMAEIRLNNALLANEHLGPFGFDVTAILKQHNRLEVTIAADSDRAGLWGEVALEVRCSAYLRDMNAQRREDGELEVAGMVAGTCDSTLELYGLADRGNAHYQLIEARPEGTPFRFSIPPRTPPVQRVRVELVNVATVWYAWESLLPSPQA